MTGGMTVSIVLEQHSLLATSPAPAVGRHRRTLLICNELLRIFSLVPGFSSIKYHLVSFVRRNPGNVLTVYAWEHTTFTMSSILSSLITLAPWHLTSFATLLGSELYQVCTLALAS